MYPIIHQCPTCKHQLHVTKLACNHCHTTIENNFSLSKFALLSNEQMHFVEVFLVSRGNIKEVEKSLGISYPTVRTKLNEIIELLGYTNNPQEKESKKEIVHLLQLGEISAEEAIRRLKSEEE